MSTFGTTQNNSKDNNISINTRSYQFFNKDGIQSSALTIGGWNENMSIRINPALEPSKQTEGRTFDYDRFVASALTLEKATLLLYRIEKDIIPAMEAGTDKSVGIQVGGDSLLVIGTGKKLTGSIRPFIAIHKSLNADTKKPEMSMYYEFKSASSIDDYDEKTGSYAMSESFPNEFNLFILLIRSFIQAGSGFGAHAVRFNERFSHARNVGTINAIAQKVGVPVQNSGYSGGGYKRNNIFDNPSNNQQQSLPDADYTDIGDINDLNELANM